MDLGGPWARSCAFEKGRRLVCIILGLGMLVPFVQAYSVGSVDIDSVSLPPEIRAPGVLEYVCIEDAPGGAGSPVTNAFMNFSETLSLHAVGYDSEGGFVQDLNMSWGLHMGGMTMFKHDISRYDFEPDKSYVGVDVYWFSVEDMLSQYDFPNEYNRTENITVWWPFPDPEMSMTVDVFVDDGVYLGPGNIQANLTRYINDIENDPYKPYSVTLYNGTWANDTDVKPILINDYANNNLKGAVMIGQVPSPLIEGIGPFGYELKPADYYYMDLDGIWGDSDGDGNWNWTETSGEFYCEIFCGRISPDCITAATGKSEKWLINNYLQKDHDYRTGVLLTNKSGYSCARNNHDDVWEDIFPDTIVQNYNGTVEAAMEYNRHMNDGHEGVYLEVHGSATTHEPGASINDPNQFIVLASCECGDYSVSNNVATRYSFAPDDGLVTFATSQYCQSGSDLISFPQLDGYKTMGEAAMTTTRKFYTYDGLHTFGDPLLRTSEPTWDSIEIESKGHIQRWQLADRGDPIVNVLLKPGETLDLYALGCKDGGATIMNDAFVTWSVTGTLDSIEAGPSRWVRYAPTTDHTSGTITCTDGYGHTDVVNVTVDSTLLDHITIVDAPNGAGTEITTYTMTADDEITIYAAGFDSGSQYIADIRVTWGVTGTLDSVEGGPHTYTTFSPSNAPTSGTITADDGNGHADATGLITVNPGALDHIVIRDAPLGGGSYVGDRLITTDDTLQVWAAGSDAEGNFISDILTNWSVTGDLAPAPPVGPATNTTFSPGTPGLGRIVANATTGHNNETGEIIVTPGEAAEIRIVKRPAEGESNTMKLWPRANGDTIELMPSWDNWDRVNNDPPTDYMMGQYVQVFESGGYDLYKLDFPTAIFGPIDEVRVYFRISSQMDSPGTNGTPILYLNGVFSNGTAQPHTSDSFANYSQALPRPGGGTWTFQDLCELQAGINLTNSMNPFMACCSQLYVVVNFTNDTEFGDWLMTTSDSIELHSVGYDSGGIYIGEVDCTWGCTGTLDLPPPGPSSSIIFSPTTAPTSGTITADDGNTHTDATGTITVVDTTSDVPLQEGWNLISLPLEQFDEGLDWALQSIGGKWDIIQTYDGVTWLSNCTFKPDSLNDLKTLNHSVGFWINITELNVNLTVWGGIPTSTSINLFTGWNLVGYPSLTPKTITEALVGTGYDAVKGFNATAPYRISPLADSYPMQPGEGYWIHVPADVIWTVDW